MKKKVLIFVPHQDDELNVAGDLIYQFKSSGKRVYVAFATNGDYEFQARTRMKEAIHALSIFGIPKDDIFFLGYGDTLNGTGQPHIFYAEKETVSPAGHTYTYGTQYCDDYAMTYDKCHHPYTREAYQNDVTALLCNLRPDVIFAVDYDVHADHRMASLSFEQAMGRILSLPDLNYHPIVYKAFAYTTGFNAENDFYGLNLQETKKPIRGRVSHYYPEQDLFDKSIYSWSVRTRFPIAKEDQKHFLSRCKLFRAFCCHQSQSAGFHAAQVLNSDKVFWQRRTDSLSYKATINVSSNPSDAYYLTDFQLYNTTDIDAEIPSFNAYLWQPDENDSERKINFFWKDGCMVKQIILYGPLLSTITVSELSITLDDEVMLAGPLPACGKPLIISLKSPKHIHSCEIKLLKVKEGAGISECEFYDSDWQKNKILPPYIKILHNDNFIYNYYVLQNTTGIQLSIYQYECTGPIRFKIIGDTNGCYLSDDGFLNITDMTDKIRVAAELQSNPAIRDEVTIQKIRPWKMKILQYLQYLENTLLTVWLRLNRKYIHLRKKYINDI